MGVGVGRHDVHAPSVSVDDAVVVGAEHDQVFEVGFAAVFPVFDVVDDAPAWRCVAVAPCASAVSCFCCSSRS